MDFGDIEGCLFDAYGTLFDVNAAAAELEPVIGPVWQALAALWREKQLQYAWLRTLTGRHADFEQVTADALEYALESLGIDPGLHSTLLAGYRTLRPYPDVIPALQLLRAAGVPRAILSNGSPAMLEAAVDAAGVEGLIDTVLSIESVGFYKPHPACYEWAAQQIGTRPQHLLFVSSNGWDAYSAKAHGFQVAWCNRGGAPAERLPQAPDVVVRSLGELPALLALGTRPWSATRTCTTQRGER